MKGVIYIKKLLALALCIMMMLSLVSCGGYIERDFEFNSHAEFAEFIGNYNSMHDLYVDTFMSFDLDGNETVTKSIYYAFTIMPLSARAFVIKNGYLCDIHEERLAQVLTYYLKGENENESTNDYVYKIKCHFRRVPFNYTGEDEMEIVQSSCIYYNDDNDLVYEDSIRCNVSYSEEDRIYTNVYHYDLNVNGNKSCCIHISSINEASEEKLNEILQMLYDNIVVMNADGIYIWRD